MIEGKKKGNNLEQASVRVWSAKQMPALVQAYCSEVKTPAMTVLLPPKEINIIRAMMPGNERMVTDKINYTWIVCNFYHHFDVPWTTRAAKAARLAF